MGSRNQVAAFTCLLFFSVAFVSSLQIIEAQSSPFRIVDGTVEIKNIDFSNELMQLHFVFDETTGSENFKDRSSSWIIWQYGNSFTAMPIGIADPEWKLVGTNNITLWNWRLEKTIWTRYEHEGFIFPFESFKAIFYVCSNETRGFSVTSAIPNSDVDINQIGVTSAQLPANFRFEGVPEQIEVDIALSQDSTSKSVAAMLYLLYAILITIFAIILVNRRNIELSNSITITSSILVFLPILVFTFRTSIAPKYLTLVDGLGFFIMILYGLLLIFELLFRNRRRMKI